MSDKTNYLQGKILEHVLGGAAYTQPTPFVGLFSAAPSDAGGGTELSGSGYARVDTTGKWGAAAGTPRVKANNATISFPTATGDWVTATHFGIFDAVSAGNLLYWHALTNSKTVQNGDTASYASGALTVTEN